MASAGKTIVSMAAMKKQRQPSGDDATDTTSRGRVSAAEHVYTSLRTAILQMQLKPGSLLDETSISEEFQVSRSPVREALVRLNAERLVQTLRNRSTVVTHFDASDLPAYFDALQLMYRATARLGALNRTERQLTELENIDRIHKSAALGDILGTIRGNRDFHCKIAECSANTYLHDWSQTLMDQGQRLLFMYLRRHSNTVKPSDLDHHRALIRAIRDRDGDAAEAAARADAEVLRSEISSALGASPSSAIDL